MTRRSLLSQLLSGAGLVVAGILVVPSVISILSPVLRPHPREAWRSLGSVDQFPVGEMQMIAIQLNEDEWPRIINQKGVYVHRQAEEDFVVFSRSCTDLSCPVQWDAGSQWFFCPCHGGIFSREGERVAGPPRRPLYRYSNRIRNNILEIDLRSVPPMI